MKNGTEKCTDDSSFSEDAVLVSVAVLVLVLQIVSSDLPEVYEIKIKVSLL